MKTKIDLAQGLRYSQLTTNQRQQAVDLAVADGRPNCIGLRFHLDPVGIVVSFTDSTPRIPHGTDLAQVAQSILGQPDPTPAELRAQADNLEKHASRRSYSGVEDRDKARLLREKASSIEAAAASHTPSQDTPIVRSPAVEPSMLSVDPVEITLSDKSKVYAVAHSREWLPSIR